MAWTLAGNLGQHGGRIARPGADLQDPVAGLYLGRVDHQGDDVRLGDGLAFADPQGCILVGEFLEAGVDEDLARDAAHGRKHMAVADAPARDLDIHHPVAGADRSSIGASLR